MLSVIYVSVADPLLSPADIDAILVTARRNNARDALTGALIYNGHNFMQLLEGPADRVDACLAAIREDRRHSGMIEIRRRAIERREFADWTMLYEPGFQGQEVEFARLAANGRLDPEFERMLGNFVALGRRSPSAGGQAPLQ
ncbi:BLUF domain-containing protein [Sphingopyxis alaskensis]|uniref:BLUF n=1 Tax=Sphingopyxis alaskensis (strain DSM 13593 / LMG 18877 / RB2256) TaxID=317655 RepID=Q1GWG4_SPHAL|nr:BLUF domain-containing protein [Sphingopyxis alaskensis]ABF52008.1 BLUF [Sphingopyxis alaskensis RB2256]MCM3419299.1 BLUF domain-containing protein [Sphingopyxis alaskensis]